MISYIKMHGVRIENPNAPIIQSTPEGKAIGGIPGWSAMIDPSHVSGLHILNRVNNENGEARNFGSGATGTVPIGEFPNGEPAFEPTAANQVEYDPRASINPDAWTMFTVAMLASASQLQQIVGTLGVSTSPEIAPKFAITNGGNGLRVYPHGESTAGARLEHNGSLTTSPTPLVLMATFSVRDGLRMFVNTQQVAAAPADTRPLTARYEAGQWGFLRGVQGRYGMTGVLNTDLGQPEHHRRRMALISFMMQKYGIS